MLGRRAILSPIHLGAREGHPELEGGDFGNHLLHHWSATLLAVAETYQEIEQAAESLGLQINEAKTKLMVTTPAALPTNNPNLRRCDIQLGERIFEVVPQ